MLKIKAREKTTNQAYMYSFHNTREGYFVHPTFSSLLSFLYNYFTPKEAICQVFSDKKAGGKQKADAILTHRQKLSLIYWFCNLVIKAKDQSLPRCKRQFRFS